MEIRHRLATRPRNSADSSTARTLVFTMGPRFYWVLLGSAGFYGVLLGSAGFCQVLLGSTEFSRNLAEPRRTMQNPVEPRRTPLERSIIQGSSAIVPRWQLSPGSA